VLEARLRHGRAQYKLADGAYAMRVWLAIGNAKESQTARRSVLLPSHPLSPHAASALPTKNKRCVVTLRECL
jgi:hypothetical protein